MPSESEKLAQFLVACLYDNLPAEAISRAKSFLLDHLGVAIYSSRLPWSRMVLELAQSEHAVGPCTVYGQSWKTNPRSAALVHGTFGHGFELDDTHEPAMGHPGPCIIPAALALTERDHCSGQELLQSIILGYEVFGRVGRAVAPSIMISRGFHPTGTNGVFGATTAAAFALGLDEHRLVQALGIAGSLASGISEFCEDEEDGMVKRLHGGRAAEGGILAALLAQQGFTGPRTVLEGRFGYCHAFADEARIEFLTSGLGETWEILSVSIKPYACGRIFHPVFDALALIKAQREIRLQEIKRVRVGGTKKMVEQHMTYRPGSVMAAQYSLPFTTAAAVVRDPFDPETFGEQGLADKQIWELIDRIEAYEDPEMEGLAHKKFGARVIIELNDETTLSSAVLDSKGGVENPLTTEELQNKFLRLASTVFPAERCREIIEVVSTIDSLKDVAELTSLLRVEG